MVIAKRIAEAKQYSFSFSSDKGIRHNDRWDVYSAPSLNAVRGANGKAMVRSYERIMTAGWNGAWLMIRYEKSEGVRIGWVANGQIGAPVETDHEIMFARWTMPVRMDCAITDDPVSESETLKNVVSGEEVIYLAHYQEDGGKEYAYIKTDLDGKLVYGFIPFDAIDW